MRLPRIFTPRLVLRRGADALAYMTRYGIRTRLFSIYLHRFEAPDPGHDLHDHPWHFLSVILRGGYTEERFPIDMAVEVAAEAEGINKIAETANRVLGMLLPWQRRGLVHEHYGFGSLNHMPLSEAHRITEVVPGSLTLVFCGPVRRSWGFYTPIGYIDHNEYDHPDRSLVAEYRDDMSAGERGELA